MKSPFPYQINFAFVVALVAVGLDVIFHITLTEPMESFDYFAVKFLIGFSVTTVFLNWPPMASGKKMDFYNRFTLNLIPALLFTFFMSLYYRWWEYLSGVPYGVRPPDIIFIDRNNTFLFALAWFIGHTIFYLVGSYMAKKLVKNNESSPSKTTLGSVE